MCGLEDELQDEMAILKEKNTKEKLLLSGVSKRYAWLKPDGTTSDLWNEEYHKKCLTDEDIQDAEVDGWRLLQFNAC